MKEGRQRARDPYLLLANPVLTVKELLGHASVQTTMHYLNPRELHQTGALPQVA